MFEEVFIIPSVKYLGMELFSTLSAVLLRTAFMSEIFNFGSG